MDASNLKKTKAWFRATGYVNEKRSLVQNKDGSWETAPMQIVETERDEYIDGNKTGKTIPCERLNGSIILKTDKGLQEFRINFYSKTSNGEDSKQWKMAQKIAKWVPAIDPKSQYEGEPSYVSMQGSLGNYDSISKKDSKVYSNLQWNATSKCEHINEDEKSGCTLLANCYFKSKREETTMRDGEPEPTGRLIITMYGVDNNGGCYPITCIVEKDMADDFCFEPDTTLDCEFNRVVRHVGSTKNKKRAFGGGKSDVEVSNGFDVEELILVGADVIEEPEDMYAEDDDGNPVEVKTDYIAPEAMTKALKERAIKLEEMVKDGGKKSGGKSMQDRKAEKRAQKNSMPKPSKSFEEPYEDDSDDDPF